MMRKMYLSRINISLFVLLSSSSYISGCVFGMCTLKLDYRKYHFLCLYDVSVKNLKFNYACTDA